MKITKTKRNITKTKAKVSTVKAKTKKVDAKREDPPRERVRKVVVVLLYHPKDRYKPVEREAKSIEKAKIRRAREAGNKYNQ
jgi:hypothetical protein